MPTPPPLATHHQTLPALTDIERECTRSGLLLSLSNGTISSSQVGANLTGIYVVPLSSIQPSTAGGDGAVLSSHN